MAICIYFFYKNVKLLTLFKPSTWKRDFAETTFFKISKLTWFFVIFFFMFYICIWSWFVWWPFSKMAAWKYKKFQGQFEHQGQFTIFAVSSVHLNKNGHKIAWFKAIWEPHLLDRVLGIMTSWLPWQRNKHSIFAKFC